MKKIETLWHYLLWEALTKRNFEHTQEKLAEKFHYSLSTIHHGLKTLTRIGAIKKHSRGFVLINPKKLLFYWGSVRNLTNNITYQTFSPAPPLQIEGELPGGGIYGAFTAARLILKEAPADYNQIYYYYPFPQDFQKRFPPNNTHPPNIFVLKMKNLENYSKLYPGGFTTLAHTFVDIWNISTWYATDFLRALEEKIDELLP